MNYNCFSWDLFPQNIYTCYWIAVFNILFLHYTDVCNFSDTMFRNMVSLYTKESSAPHPTPKLEDLHLLIVCYCLFNISVATVHIWRPSSVSATCDCHSVLTGTHLSQAIFIHCLIFGSQECHSQKMHIQNANFFTHTHTNESPVALV